ncbi:uncharacterized protein LOC121302948 [Polyodon spathula]|uniref:uncharacterized protein LOC121302948 n=1 Tax=Polyodon spathula TaxID=7913 RepID=UPI001B7F2702|nr:uncharacterized protein LOC121302948 [Polyodon spathula]
MKAGHDSKQQPLLFFLYFLCHACCVASKDSADSCQWLWINSNDLTVNCTSKDLRAVPQGIPVQAYSIQLDVNRISCVRRSDFPQYAFNTLKFNLSHNRVRKIADGAFESFPNLEQLDLSNNRIKTLRDDSFRGLLKLKELHLGNNVISEVPLFHNLLSIQALWLQSNGLIQIPAVKFMASLKVLSLASNKIVSVDSGSFRGCGSLAELHMQHNLISRVAGEGFDGLFQLKMLNLSCNLLETIPPKAFQAFVAQETDLVLHNNPWQCNCNMDELKRSAPTSLAQRIRCHTGPLAGHYLSTVNQEQLTCKESLRVSHVVTVTVPAGRGLKLTCETKNKKGQLLYWQTPFRQHTTTSIYSSEDLTFVLSDGSLNIVRFSAHLSGIYYCVFGYAEEKLITLYKVSLMDHGILERGRLREKREYEQYVELVSEEHFASAIAASVIITFLGAFILGAISRSFFNECCRKIKPRRNATKAKLGLELKTEPRQYENMVFAINEEPKEETPIYDILKGSESIAEESSSGHECSYAKPINTHKTISLEVPEPDKEFDVSPPRPAPRLKFPPRKQSKNTEIPEGAHSELAHSLHCHIGSPRYEIRTSHTDAEYGPNSNLSTDNIPSTLPAIGENSEADYVIFPVCHYTKVDPVQHSSIPLSEKLFNHSAIIPNSPQTFQNNTSYVAFPEEPGTNAENSVGLHNKKKGLDLDKPLCSEEENVKAKQNFLKTKMQEGSSDVITEEEKPNYGICPKVNLDKTAKSENPEAHGEISHKEQQTVDLNQRDQNSGMNKDNQEGPSSSEESGELSQHQPKAAKRRVIKLYNYDEEGKLYDHIKSSEEFESESEPRMKRRSLSLTRLNAIMSVALAEDFSSESKKNQKQSNRDENDMFNIKK